MILYHLGALPTLAYRPEEQNMVEYFFLFLLFFFGVLFVASMVLVHFGLGNKRNVTPTKLEPFECGSPVVHQPHERVFHVKYSTVAILFLLFDLETILLYPWAISASASEKTVLVAGLGFLFLLTFALIYVWKKGLLHWQ